MQRFALPAAALLLLVPAADAEAQSFEVFGNVGYSLVDIVDWANDNVVDPNRIAYGFSGQVLWGSTGPAGLQVSIEAGYQHYLSYTSTVTFGGGDNSDGAFGGSGLARIWMGEGAFFLEGGMGVVFFEGLTDPTATVGIGKVFGSEEGMRIPVKLRLAAIFDGQSILAPVSLSVGYQIGP